ncbi:hypothetical protein Golob_017141, partial [Gossypium lobatum]|nr:hypothetical protein [Gossypium lobatum]
MDKWTKPIVIVLVDPTVLKNGQPCCFYVFVKVHATMMILLSAYR